MSAGGRPPDARTMRRRAEERPSAWRLSVYTTEWRRSGRCRCGCARSQSAIQSAAAHASPA